MHTWHPMRMSRPFRRNKDRLLHETRYLSTRRIGKARARTNSTAPRSIKAGNECLPFFYLYVPVAHPRPTTVERDVSGPAVPVGLPRADVAKPMRPDTLGCPVASAGSAEPSNLLARMIEYVGILPCSRNTFDEAPVPLAKNQSSRVRSVTRRTWLCSPRLRWRSAPASGLARVSAPKALPVWGMCYVVRNTFSVILYQAASPSGSIIKILCSCTFSRY